MCAFTVTEDGGGPARPAGYAPGDVFDCSSADTVFRVQKCQG